jgi:hypothetical protein
VWLPGWLPDDCTISPSFPVGAAGAAGPERRQASASVRLLLFFSCPFAQPPGLAPLSCAPPRTTGKLTAAKVGSNQ